MAISSVLKILESVQNSYGLTRTLGEIQLWRDCSREIFYRVGNSIMLFKIRYKGEWRAMRCYARHVDNLSAIYGDKYLPAELYIYTGRNSGQWIDVVLEEWVDGVTLSQRVKQAVDKGDRSTLQTIATRFDIVARDLLQSECAHGDLTAENILVTPELQIRLIDFDGMYLPLFQGMCSPEIGTAAYNPLSRTSHDFDRNIDDYSIALISTALHTLALEPSLYHKHRYYDGLLFDPKLINNGTCEALEESIAMFLERNMSRQYRVAMLLKMNTLRIAPLAPIFRSIGAHASPPHPLELTMLHGYVGYASPHNQECVIPNIYDDGLEFREGAVMVRLSSKWLAIDPSGNVIMEFKGCQRVKSFRNGIARVLRDGAWEDVKRLEADFSEARI